MPPASIGYFYILTFIIGFGAIVLVSTIRSSSTRAFWRRRKRNRGDQGRPNMAAIHLANAVGGNMFLGFISAVAFATILAVVSGLTLPGASARQPRPLRHGDQGRKGRRAGRNRVSKIATLFLGVLAIILGIVFENQNVAFMVALAFAIAASATSRCWSLRSSGRG